MVSVGIRSTPDTYGQTLTTITVSVTPPPPSSDFQNPTLHCPRANIKSFKDPIDHPSSLTSPLSDLHYIYIKRLTHY